MTRARLGRLLRRWQKVLKLEHWQLDLDFDNPTEEGHDSEAWYSQDYDKATIRFSVEWPTWADRFAAETIAHELMHIQLRGINVAVDSLEGLIGKDSQAAFDKRWNHELEGLCDRVAICLVDLAE